MNKLNVRMPAGLRDQLEHEAERQGTSLNTLIVTLLAGSIAYRPTNDRDEREKPDDDPESR